MTAIVGALRSRATGRAAPTDTQLGLSWLLMLRWGAVTGQLVAILVARWALQLDLPFAALLCCAAFTAITNAAIGARASIVQSDGAVFAVLVTDVVVLTVMLALSGGAHNPFTVFYLVHVALAAVLVDARRAWAVVALVTSAFACLSTLATNASAIALGGGSVGAAGAFVAFALAAGFVTHFVGRVSRGLRERDRQRTELEQLARQNERLATLSAFAANAAHELGSPLGTIAVTASELVHAARASGADESFALDAELVRREVARCREILADISARAGESVGEMPVEITPHRVVEILRELMHVESRSHLRLALPEDLEHVSLFAPPKTLAQMLRNLVRNAREAHDVAHVGEPVELRVASREQHVCFHVLDRGAGVPTSVRNSLGEPFVTTKHEQGGLGLGVYLARAYAERTGGTLRHRDRAGGGTDVELRLPRHATRGVR